MRDCLAHAELGNATGQVNLTVAPHDVRVLVLTPLAPSTGGGGGGGGGGARGWGRAEDAAWAARWKGHGIRMPQSRLAREAARRRETPEVEEA